MRCLFCAGLELVLYCAKYRSDLEVTEKQLLLQKAALKELEAQAAKAGIKGMSITLCTAMQLCSCCTRGPAHTVDGWEGLEAVVEESGEMEKNLAASVARVTALEKQEKRLVAEYVRVKKLIEGVCVRVQRDCICSGVWWSLVRAQQQRPTRSWRSVTRWRKL